MEDLQAIHDSRASFYNKAQVQTTDTRKTLLSYNTEVAFIENNKAVVLGWFSGTTGRRLKEFLKQNDFKAESKAQILKDYGRE